jgi:predicted PurR-regulated permease PerM
MSLVVLATLAVGYTLWAAQDIILPVLLAMFFALVGNPILRLLQKLWIPRALGALLILGAGLGVTGSLAVQLIGPAMEWAQEAQQLRKVARQVQDLTKPVQQANQAAENFARVAGGDSNHKVQVIRTQLDDPYRMLTRAPRLAASVLAVVLLTLFFMIYGQSLQRAAIALFPNRQQQRFTTDILRSIEREVSRYVLTISVINTLVGLVFAGVLMLLGIGLQEALLWGTVAALLNFAPYVGPLIGVALMLLMGFVEFRDPLQALLPGRLPGPAHPGRADGDPDRAGPSDEAVAAGADPGADGVRLGLGHDRAAAGGAAAGVHQAGAGTPGRHAGLGTPAGMKARAGRGRMAG